MKEHARPSSWDQEDDFLAFPVSGLSLPGDTQGRDCCQSPLIDLIMPKLPSPGIKLISQMWGSDNWQLRTFCVGPQVSLTACNCRTHVDFSGKQPAFLFAQFDSCTLVKEHPKFWLVAFSFQASSLKESLISLGPWQCHTQARSLQPCLFRSASGGEKDRTRPSSSPFLPTPYFVRGNDLDSFVR